MTLKELLQILLNSNSIYKNQAIELSDNCVPKIMNLSDIDKEFMVLSSRTEYDLQLLNSRLLHPDRCIEKGISLKYGCLMEGPYGTGKTLLAFSTCKECNRQRLGIYVFEISGIVSSDSSSC